MKIGTILQLEHKRLGDKEVLKYACKIIEKNDHCLYIDYPVNEKTRKTEFFHKGSYFIATYIGKNESVYQFRTELVSKVSLNVPALAINLPDKGDIKRIQRREFVRVKSAVDVAVYSANQSFTPFTAVTDDISGGGMSLILPNGTSLNLKENKYALIWMVLKLSKENYQYYNIHAEFVHINKLRNGLQIASLKFVAIAQNIQQQIIHYVFEKQRETRKKELKV